MHLFELHDVLRGMREHDQLSLQQAAERLGMKDGDLADFERAARYPTLGELNRLLHFYRHDFTFILHEQYTEPDQLLLAAIRDKDYRRAILLLAALIQREEEI